MKSFVSILFLSLGMGAIQQVFAQEGPRVGQYVCECVDTGVECDGLEKMKLVLKGPQAAAVVTDADGDFPTKLKLQQDPSYAPIKNKSYLRYLNAESSSKKTYRSLLIQKPMIRGSRSGTVKMLEVSNGGATEWQFNCRVLSAQR